MNAAVDVLLGISVLMAWLSVLAFLRLRTPFERLHVVTFVNVASLGPVVLAALLTDGITSRSLKCVFIWIATLTAGALLAHATARALHFREGERR